jgi:predicted acylesterase/phospholipase RssA
VVSTNVKNGATVTFDSYSKASEFGRYHKDTSRYEGCVIKYDKGIELRHIVASASIPLFYKFEDIDGEKFCDGGVLSNTPLREVLQAHRVITGIRRREKVKPGLRFPNWRYIHNWCLAHKRKF